MNTPRRIRPPQKGDRYLDMDDRRPGRVVEVRAVLPLGFVRVQTEVHPTNPTAVGLHRVMRATTLRDRYHRISN